MSTIIAVSKQQLDQNPGLLAQLQSLVEQTSTLEEAGEYSFLPLPEYEQSFIRLLEINNIAYHIPKL
jgi:hypothetical protein